jgi:hypothetical protein
MEEGGGEEFHVNRSLAGRHSPGNTSDCTRSSSPYTLNDRVEPAKLTTFTSAVSRAAETVRASPCCHIGPTPSTALPRRGPPHSRVRPAGVSSPDKYSWSVSRRLLPYSYSMTTTVTSSEQEVKPLARSHPPAAEENSPARACLSTSAWDARRSGAGDTRTELSARDTRAGTSAIW